eukprot:scaffold918_cov126-Cylindrotheca_fusiformis.AAC.23
MPLHASTRLEASMVKLLQLSPNKHKILSFIPETSIMTEQQQPQDPAMDEPTPESTDAPVKPTEEESTHAESEEGSNAEEKQIQAKGFDFATLTSCCNFGTTKGNCVLCHQSIGLSDATVTIKEEGDEEELAHIECYQQLEASKSENATKIQAAYRGTKTRSALKEQAEREAAEKTAQNGKGSRTAAAKQGSKPKKTFMQKLFGGCKGSNTAAVEQN